MFWKFVKYYRDIRCDAHQQSIYQYIFFYKKKSHSLSETVASFEVKQTQTSQDFFHLKLFSYYRMFSLYEEKWFMLMNTREE